MIRNCFKFNIQKRVSLEDVFKNCNGKHFAVSGRREREKEREKERERKREKEREREREREKERE